MAKRKQKKALDVMAKDPNKPMGKVLLEAGYNKKTSEHPDRVLRTQSFQALLAKYDDRPIMDAIYKDALSKTDKRVAYQNRHLYLKVKGHLKENLNIKTQDSDQKEFLKQIQQVTGKD